LGRRVAAVFAATESKRGGE
jgi:hypothetical protein